MDEMKKPATQEELIAKARELAEGGMSRLSNQVADLKKAFRKTINSEMESMADKQNSDTFYKLIDQISAREAEVLASIKDKKNEIIAEAKAVLEEPNFKKGTEMMNELMDKWKAAGRTGSKEEDDALWAQFREARNAFFDKKSAFFEGMRKKFAESKSIKEGLIEEAKKANELESFKEIGAIMSDLMEKWKAAGNAGRDHEEKLWEAFNAQRKAFYDRREAYFKNVRERRNNSEN